ncbi:MAG: hypothetical protein U0703_11375 [Anaerolineae bacterium]
MNSLITETRDILTSTQGLRAELLNVLTDVLSDADLGYSLPGNPTLGEMFREEAEIERSYMPTRSRPSRRRSSTAKAIQRWRPTSTSSRRIIRRSMPIWSARWTAFRSRPRPEHRARVVNVGAAQLAVYFQAVLIFFGKATIYFRAAGKPLPEQWKAWIG